MFIFFSRGSKFLMALYSDYFKALFTSPLTEPDRTEFSLKLRPDFPGIPDPQVFALFFSYPSRNSQLRLVPGYICIQNKVNLQVKMSEFCWKKCSSSICAPWSDRNIMFFHVRNPIQHLFFVGQRPFLPTR
jgi:hypothetical protein